MHKKLWQVIQELARIRVFLYQTDHLSDRDLYALLWKDLLRESIEEVPGESKWTTHLDILGGCSQEDQHNYNKYYADEFERADYAADWEGEFPEYVDLPYDRDRRLPKAPTDESKASSQKWIRGPTLADAVLKCIDERNHHASTPAHG